MAHIDSARRIGRLTHVERWIDIVDGVPVLADHVVEHGRRAGLHTHRSETSEHRRRSNRNERHGVRRQLRADPDLVPATPRKNDSVWLTR